MRVALASDWFLPRAGGIELHLRDLALALRAQGVDARIVTTTRGADDVDGVPVYRVASAISPIGGVAVSPRLPRRVRQLIEAEHFDVVHAHASVVSPLAYLAVTSANALRLPAVLTFHSMLYRTAALLGAAEALAGWSGRVVLTAVSSVVAAQLASGMPDASIAVLPNAIDTRFWSRDRERGEDGDIHFVSAMRLSRKKRPLELVRAFARAVKFTAGAPNVRLTLAGDGPERVAVRRLADELGVGGSVRLLGSVTREQLRALYSMADVFVLPSERESFGLAALEARAAGLPVIAMLAGGARDFITPGVNGFLARDHRELGTFMGRLATDDALRRYIAFRNRVPPSEYDWRHVATTHQEIYSTAAALRRENPSSNAK